MVLLNIGGIKGRSVGTTDVDSGRSCECYPSISVILKLRIEMSKVVDS